jgi:hypothetical protein
MFVKGRHPFKRLNFIFFKCWCFFRTLPSWLIRFWRGDLAGKIDFFLSILFTTKTQRPKAHKEEKAFGGTLNAATGTVAIPKS